VVDYARHARQIALAEVGAEGQRALADTPVDLTSLAAELHQRAGGAVASGAALRVTLPEAHPSPTWTLGASAWACVEAAREVLGAAPKPMPEGLFARLAVTGNASEER
jgi:hypothetical protein